MRDAVLAVERAYVDAGTRAPTAGVASGDPDVAAAAMGAVASRFLAVGTPRSIGLVGDPAAMRRSLDAHRLWFSPRDIRVVGDAAAAAALDPGARVTSLDEALAADIVCVHAPIAIAARSLRRGTHVNVLVAGVELDPALATLATITHEVPGLAALAAGLVDGRQLDEITLFVIGDAAIARAAL